MYLIGRMHPHETLYRRVLESTSTIKDYHTPLYKLDAQGISGTCAHPDCRKMVYTCTYCLQIVCPTLRCTDVYMRLNGSNKKHRVCEICATALTCAQAGMCRPCAKHHTYDMITEHLAVGSYSTPYTPFDIIVNLDFPENDARDHEITIRQVRRNPSLRSEKETALKPMILCGFYDSDHEMGSMDLRRILDCIATESKRFMLQAQRLPVILIHCTLGVSRSSTIAIAYLAELLGISTQAAYFMVKEKRKCICPNPGFRSLLGI